MLHELRVQNLALIDSLCLDVGEQDGGLIVLTGETGAGKSIILQAIHLLGGGRSSASWVRNESEQAWIEAIFEIEPQHRALLSLMEEHELLNGSTCIVRRVITSKGRSKIYINDQLVTARVAGDLADGLVNIASQHDNQQLLQVRRHIDFVDSYGELWEMRDTFTGLFQKWQQLSSELRQLLEKEQGKEQQKDFLLFQLEEIESIKPVPGEEEQLQEERSLLHSSAKLVEIGKKAQQLFSGTVLERLAEIRKLMEQLAEMDPTVESLAERGSTVCYEIEDIEQELARYSGAIPTDLSRLDVINERLAALKQLQRKYGTTLEEVVAFGEKIKQEIATLESLGEQIQVVELQLEKISTKALLKATELSHARKEAAQKMELAMEKELASLSFNQAVFQVTVGAPEGLGLEGIQSTGLDTVEFLFSANPGEPAKSLAKIASGGELSRLMLAMKCILARRDQVDTVIFDEVDAGISGQAAEAVAEKIGELSQHHQVICITHLPQIAAGADLHFKIEKKVEQGRTATELMKLSTGERVEELARMLAGQEPTSQTMAYAKELIERKQQRREG